MIDRSETVTGMLLLILPFATVAGADDEAGPRVHRGILVAQMVPQERAEVRKSALEQRRGGRDEAEPAPDDQVSMTAQSIREIQRTLVALGYRPGPIDGIWGVRTTRALRAFLRDAGHQPPLTLTQTLHALRSAVRRTADPESPPPDRQQVESQPPAPQPFTVVAEPGAARVRIVNSREPYRAGMALGPGAYEVEVSAGGYETVRETVRHGTEATEHRITLVPAEPRRQAGEYFRDCPVCPEVVVVPPGSFLMGSPVYEEGRRDTEGPQQEVTISQPLAVGVYEVTFAQWDACTRNGGCDRYRPDDNGWNRGRQPVLKVSWVDAQGYVEWLARETGKAYRLPSEAEWEYLARAGSQTPFHFGQTITPQQANYDTKYIYGGGWKAIDRRRPIPVGNFQPNAFGLYDMHGNIWEWVQDCWNRDHAEALRDGRARTTGDCSRHVLRGGSWIFSPRVLRSASRHGYATDYRYSHVGFRVVRTFPFLIPPGTDEDGPGDAAGRASRRAGVPE